MADTEFTCCAHIEGPIRWVHRGHGHKHATEQWRVGIEAAPDCADALADHLKSHLGHVHSAPEALGLQLFR